MIGHDPLVAHKQRAVQRRTRPRLGSTAWDPAPATIGGSPGGPGARHGPGGRGERRRVHGGRTVRRYGCRLSPQTGTTAPVWLPRQTV
jgi:hypothetical protein